MIPALTLYLLYRGIRVPSYFHCLRERFGFLPASLETTGAGAIWFHAVSVGEVLSVIPVIRHLKAEWPHVRIYVSTTTLAGREMADQKLGLADGIFFAPFDYRSVVRNVLRRLRPALVVVIETEIWPNLFPANQKLDWGIPVGSERQDLRSRAASVSPLAWIFPSRVVLA